jgi:hypothetical protein
MVIGTVFQEFLTFLRTSSINLEPTRHFPPYSQIAALAADCLHNVNASVAACVDALGDREVCKAVTSQASGIRNVTLTKGKSKAENGRVHRVKYWMRGVVGEKTRQVANEISRMYTGWVASPRLERVFHNNLSAPSTLAKLITFHNCNMSVPGSTVGRNTRYPEYDSSWYSSVPEANFVLMIFFLVFWGAVRLDPLDTLATICPIVPGSDDRGW